MGARAGRRVRLGDARAVRHPLAVVRGRLVPADRHDGADFRRRAGALVGGTQDRSQEESELGAGTLFSSGLIAGGSICGILYAVLVGTQKIGPFQAIGNAIPWFHVDSGVAQLATALLFLALAAVTARMAKRSVM